MKTTSDKTEKKVGPFTVPLLFIPIFAILIVGQYASKNGALLLNQGRQSAGFIYISIGYSCLFFRGLIWMILLKYARLSVAYPIQALSFILITFLGVFAFNEILSTWKILGMFFIISGVLLISLFK